MNLLTNLLCGLLLLLPFSAAATLPPQIEADFATHSGYVIMPIGDEYLVDLDATVNLQEGDILTLITAGEKVIHPVTKEVLGSVDTPIGYLYVTRIKSGYSYAKLLSSEKPPQKGDQVRRFEQVPTRFIDTQETDTAIRQQLQSGLPQLNWLADDSNELPLLTFSLANRNLQVKSSSGNLLHSYSIADGQLMAPLVPVTPVPGLGLKKEPKALQKAVNSLIGTFKPESAERDPAAGLGIIQQQSARQSGLWMGPNLTGSPVGIAVADLDGDGLQEIAVALDNKLLISQLNGDQYSQQAEVAIPARLQLLSLDALDLDNDGRAELYLTAASEHRLASFVVEYSDSEYQVIARDINWYLRAVELAETGPALIGQLMGTDENSFYGKPFRIQRAGNQLEKGEEIRLPGRVNLFSFAPFTDKDGRQLYAYLTATDYLKVISADGEELWESADYYGGSETGFENRKEHQGDTVIPTYIRSRLIKTPNGEILVAQNEGLRTLQRYRMYKESRLISMSWNGYALVENWRTTAQNGYLGDFAYADADNDGQTEIVMAIKFKHKSILREARSALVTFDVN